MKEKCEYLWKLGFSEETINHYMKRWFEENFDFLYNYKENVYLNLKCMQESFSENLLMKFLIHYPQTFIMDPVLFEERFNLIKTEFPDVYDEIIEGQYWGYDGIDGTFGGETPPEPAWNSIPYLMSMARKDEDVKNAIESLKHPRTRVYRFVQDFDWQCEIDVTAEDIADEDWLLDIERFRWDMVHNITSLKNKKMPKEIIEDIVYFCPHILMDAETQVESILVEHFGENYVETMQKKAEEENWGDILYGLN
jgi:hypothetical protein